MNKSKINNRAYNYLHACHISMERLEEIEKLLVESAKTKTKFYLYKKLCELAPNSLVTKEASSFIIEIDSEKNRNLVDDIQRTFLIRVLKRTRTNKQKKCHMKVGNVFLKIKVFK